MARRSWRTGISSSSTTPRCASSPRASAIPTSCCPSAGTAWRRPTRRRRTGSGSAWPSLASGSVEVDVATFMPWEPERGDRYSGPAAAFLVQTDDGTNILVDTGLAPEHLENPEARVPQPLVVVTMRPEDDIRNRLAEIGLAPH